MRKLFKGDMAWASNFYPSEIMYLGDVFPTAEHLYQMFKTKDPKEREALKACKTAVQVRRLSRKVTLREDWDLMKFDVMRSVQMLKYTNNKELASKLKDTKDEDLVEWNYWGDKYWGKCLRTGEGENNLGLILQDVKRKV